jgi:hypothetical protein
VRSVLPIAAGLLVGSTLIVTAQVQTRPTVQTSGVPTGIVMTGNFAGMTGPVAGITGHPYSAQEETEHVQTLADGTRITEPAQIVVYYRDSQGRTRIERHTRAVPGLPSSAPAPVFVDINDPVAGYRYTLEPNSHIAHRTSFGPVRDVQAPPPAPWGSADARFGMVTSSTR